MSQSNTSIWRGAGRTPFVGRSAELAALRARLAAAGQGEGGVVLIAGEPGIGKTRLAGELAELAQADGWTVLAGRAYQAEGPPPYLPFIEALRAYIRAAEPETLRRQLGQGAKDVALLVRDVRAALPEIPPTEPSAAEIDRYTLFESIADFLIAITVESGHPLSEVLAELVRGQMSADVPLRGLGEAPRPTPARTPEPCNWNGTWRHGPRGQPDLMLTLTGNMLTGTFGYYGRVSGTVSGDTFTGNVTSDRGVANALQFRIGWSTDGGGRLTNFIACFYMAVKIGNEGWTDFQR